MSNTYAVYLCEQHPFIMYSVLVVKDQLKVKQVTLIKQVSYTW